MKPENVNNPETYRAQYGIPAVLSSCHTAIIDGYAIEGHVPAREIKKLLAERPKARGLAVAGMPGSAPGMESSPPEPYDVFLVLPDGRYQIYARYGR